MGDCSIRLRSKTLSSHLLPQPHSTKHDCAAHLRFLSLVLLSSDPFAFGAFETDDEVAAVPALRRGGSALEASASESVSLPDVALWTLWLILDMNNGGFRQRKSCKSAALNTAISFFFSASWVLATLCDGAVCTGTQRQRPVTYLTTGSSLLGIRRFELAAYWRGEL